jgi:bacillithiol biosynthesis deacetylase BshB1
MIKENKVDILAVGVHPDDIELGCSATLLKHIELGYSVGLLDLTQGELGTRGNAVLRLEEAEAARELMGAKFRWNASLADGFFQNNEESIKTLIKYIRAAKPKIILCNAPHDRHPDHGRASKLTREACFYAGLKKIESFNEDGSLQDPWRPDVIYYYIQDFNLEPDFVVDVDNYFEKKIDLVMCFKTQFFNPDSKEKETPISSKAFIDFLKGRAAVHGRHIGCTHGEGFIKDRYLGVDDLFSLK